MTAGLLVLALAPCAILLAHYLRQVRAAPEPWPRVATAVLTGTLACAAVTWLYRAGRAEEVIASPWLLSFAVIAPTEEAFKLAAVLAIAPPPRRFARVTTGLVYAVAAAAGFAALENTAYVLEYGPATGVLRALTAVPGHLLHSALIGLQLGRVHRAARRSDAWRAVALGFVAAIAAHGLYDGLILGGGGALRGLAVPLLAGEAWLVGSLLRRARSEDVARDVDVLRKVPFLSGAPVAAVRLLAERAVHVQLEAAERVVREGGPGDALYIVLRGTLLVHRAREGGGDDEAIARLEPGQFFGEIALLTGEPRNADVSTISEAMLLRVPALALYEAVARIEGFTELLVKTARERSAGAEVPEPDVLRRTAATALSRAEAGREASLAASLKRIALFAELSAADRDELADASFIARYGAASTLVRQGRQGPGLCTLLSGTARVIRDGREIASLVEGDFFGEINLLTGSDATATVRSSKPVVLAVLRWRDLESVLARNPAVGVRLLGAFASRLARAETAVEIPEALLDEIARNPEVLRSLAQKIAEG